MHAPAHAGWLWAPRPACLQTQTLHPSTPPPLPPPPNRYLEQVLDTGAGVPRHPLFFLGRWREGGKKSKGGKGAAAVAPGGDGDDGVAVRCAPALGCRRPCSCVGAAAERPALSSTLTLPLIHSPQVSVEAEDVREERLRVEAMPAGGDATISGEGEGGAAAAIVIRDLHKTFPPVGGSG